MKFLRASAGISCLSLLGVAAATLTHPNPSDNDTIDVALVFQGAAIDGIVHACIWTKNDYFPICDNRAAFHAKLEAPHGVAVHVFRKIPTGIYAVGGFLDDNKNGMLDLDKNGLPKEPLVLSRAKLDYEWTSFESAAYTFNSPASLMLDLRNR